MNYEDLETVRERSRIKQLPITGPDDPKRWPIIRQAYALAMPHIMAASARRRRGRIDPYFLQWDRFFTPIETDAWFSIRSIGLPFYPQVPVGNVFIDFASPYFKIGLEIDGKQFHQDVAKDRARDEKLADAGWKIFRVSGSEAFKPAADHNWVRDQYGAASRDYIEMLDDWILRTGDGVVTALNEVYFRDNNEAFDGRCLQALDRHRLVPFDLLPDDDDHGDGDDN